MSAAPLQTKRFRFVFAISWLIWMVIHFYVLRWYHFSTLQAAIDSAISNILLAGICILVSQTLRYYFPKNNRFSYLLALCGTLTFIWLLVSRAVLVWINTGSEYQSFFSQSMVIRGVIGFLLIGCVALLSIVWNTLQEQQEQEQRKATADQLAKEAELYKLRQQLQPHFLFNSLNSINALIGLHPQEARTMIQTLSDFLRGTLKKEENQWISLDEELNHLQLYMQIEQVRFGHRLKTEIKNNTTTNSSLPAMLLQPLVENAIKFGLYDTTDTVCISIEATRQRDLLVLSIQNPFDENTSLPNKGTGFGLSSVRRRLFLLFGRNDLLQTSFEQHLFTTVITIPQHDQNNLN